MWQLSLLLCGGCVCDCVGVMSLIVRGLCLIVLRLCLLLCGGCVCDCVGVVFVIVWGSCSL